MHGRHPGEGRLLQLARLQVLGLLRMWKMGSHAEERQVLRRHCWSVELRMDEFLVSDKKYDQSVGPKISSYHVAYSAGYIQGGSRSVKLESALPMLGKLWRWSDDR